LQETRVTFASDGIELVGILRVPERAGSERLPAVVVTGALSAVKEQAAGTYAAKLADRGIATLVLDHRNYGESGGTRRQHEDPQGKLADLRDAVSFLASRPEIDPERIGVVGVCQGGGYALRLAAFDPRVKAFVSVAGGFTSPAMMRGMFGAEQYRGVLGMLSGAAQQRFASGEDAYLPAVSSDGSPATMPFPEAYEYYGTDRAKADRWENRLTVDTQWQLATTDFMAAADFVSPTPALVVHGKTDMVCTPQAAQEVFDRLSEPKEIHWLETTNHIDLYDRDEYVDPAVEKAAEFLSRHLAPAPATV
jgi:fermentation-respiration switch protein FrsA (DUF1100 family)